MPENTTPHPSAIDTAFSDIEDIIADIREGKMVIMVDDEDRENEGDLLMAAAKVRPEDVNYMATHGRGLICLTLSRERCKQLRLPLMVSETDEHHATNFTISIEAAEGITTGISAHDRSRTIDGRRYRRATRDQFHGVDRGRRGNNDRHLCARPGEDSTCCGGPGRQA